MYSTVCHYDVLSLSHSHARQCAVLARSVLTTQPRHGFLLLVPSTSTLEAEFGALMEEWGITVLTYDSLELPEEGKEFHHKQGRGWQVNYNKLHLWGLPYNKILHLDHDSLVLDNLDHLFRLPDSCGGDNFPHRTEHSNDYVKGSMIGGVLLLTPGNSVYNQLLQLVDFGWDNSSRTWAFPQAEQTIVRDILRLPVLPGIYQHYPDICWLSTDPLYYFPIRRSFIVHYTWAGVKPHHWGASPPEGSPPSSVECWTQLGRLWKHFDHQVPGWV